ncbi:MAG TPA: methylated-DNA--[protein]-cysteine S-methyltransferase [Dehalococcoidia bacterium]|nr:methylated-DNA--[protein]-cysteine S-methyltransferase [Dehalococcoidia bacterium]
MSYYDIIESPLGPVFIGASDAGIHRLDFIDAKLDRDRVSRIAALEAESGESAVQDAGALAAASAQLCEYFDGKRTAFDLTLAARGTDFQRRVWRALLDVPYGETASYGEIAEAVGKPTASRAVGAANGCNPISVIVPCHRIVGSKGALTGYGGGIERKKWLLNLEAQALRPAHVA